MDSESTQSPLKVPRPERGLSGRVPYGQETPTACGAGAREASISDCRGRELLRGRTVRDKDDRFAPA